MPRHDPLRNIDFHMRNVLLLSSGSKVALARIVAESTHKRGAILHAVDSSENVPTSHFVDSFQSFDFENEIESLIPFCQEAKIGLIIPSRHKNLLPLAKSKNAFVQAGITLAISSLETIELCVDKRQTAVFLENNRFPAPKTFLSENIDQDQLFQNLPLISKPATGSSSEGIQFLRKIEDLSSGDIAPNTIFQTLASGDEYTISVYIAKSGKCLCAIPHKRLIINSGESVQAITERNETLIQLAYSVAEALPKAWGLLNIQAFYDPETGNTQVIEINPRVGGGFPLAHQAKGHYIEWLLQEVFENHPLEPFSDWTDNLRMMRYRDAIFDFPK
tara:strand:+ start:20 stop:1015 length:996 start_codon:yes stop_codon:yes gene_type:complete